MRIVLQSCIGLSIVLLQQATPCPPFTVVLCVHCTLKIEETYIMGTRGQSVIEETEKELQNLLQLVDSLAAVRKLALNACAKPDKKTGGLFYCENVEDCKAHKPVLLSNLVDMCKAAKEVGLKVQSLNKQVAKLTAENRRLDDYRNIYSKLEEGFTGLKEEIVNSKQDNVSVGDAVDKMLPEILPKIIDPVVNEANKKWSDLFTTSKKEMKKQSTEAKHQSKLLETAMRESKQRQAIENIERQKRERNVCIRNIPEAPINSDLTNDEHDMKALAEILEARGSRPDIIISVHRVGALNKDRPRVLVGVLENPNVAKNLHNYGRGEPVDVDDKSYWINPDLIKADREANFKARQLRNKLRSSATHQADYQNTTQYLPYLEL